MEKEFLDYLDTLNGSQKEKSLAWLFFMHKKLNQKGSAHQTLNFGVLINGVKSKGFENLIEERIFEALEIFKNGNPTRSVIQSCFSVGPILPISKGLKESFLTQSQLKKKREEHLKKVSDNQVDKVFKEKRKSVAQQRKEVILEHENNRRKKDGDSNKVLTQKKRNKELNKFYRSKIQDASIQDLSAIENEIKEKVKNESLVKDLKNFIKQKIEFDKQRKRVEKKPEEPKSTKPKFFAENSISEKDEFIETYFNPPKEKVYKTLSRKVCK